MPGAGRDRDCLARAELDALAVQLHLGAAGGDEVDLLRVGVVVALRAAAGRESRLGEALQRRAAGRQAEELADRRAVLRRERLRGVRASGFPWLRRVGSRVHGGDQRRSRSSSAREGRRRSRLRDRLPHPPARDRRDDAGGRDPRVSKATRPRRPSRSSCASTRPSDRRELVANARRERRRVPPAAGRRQPRASCACWPRTTRRPRSRSTSPSTGRRGPAVGPRRRRRLAAARALAAGRHRRARADRRSAPRSGRTGATVSSSLLRRRNQ